eukprot:7498939-Pyramimonas_sp.AAC.1
MPGLHRVRELMRGRGGGARFRQKKEKREGEQSFTIGGAAAKGVRAACMPATSLEAMAPFGGIPLR